MKKRRKSCYRKFGYRTGQDSTMITKTATLKKKKTQSKSYRYIETFQ